MVIDLFSRQVIGWSLRQYMTRDIVIDALRMAWFKCQRRPDRSSWARRLKRLFDIDRQHCAPCQRPASVRVLPAGSRRLLSAAVPPERHTPGVELRSRSRSVLVCASRRMWQTAAQLVNHVIPHVAADWHPTDAYVAAPSL